MPKQWASPEHPCETVLSDRYVCLASQDHRRVQKALSFDDYMALGHVAVRHGQGPMPFDSWFLSRYGVNRRIEVTTEMFSSLPSLVVGTQRLATVQRLLAQTNQHLPNRVFEPPMEIPPLVLTAQWHKYRTLDPGLAWLRRIAGETGQSFASPSG